MHEAQVWHENVPLLAVYLPVGQVAQLAVPDVAAVLPAGHLVQDASPVEL